MLHFPQVPPGRHVRRDATAKCAVLSMGRSVLAVFFALAVAFPLRTSAFAVRKMSLGEMVERSSLVVIAAATDKERIVTSNDFKFRTRLMMVTRTLKGESPQELYLLVEGPIAEDSPQCCVTGRSYLLFLKPIVAGGYQSVDAMYGVVSIDGTAP